MGSRREPAGGISGQGRALTFVNFEKSPARVRLGFFLPSSCVRIPLRLTLAS
jgi:hypothetical protein